MYLLYDVRAVLSGICRRLFLIPNPNNFQTYSNICVSGGIKRDFKPVIIHIFGTYGFIW